MTTIVIVGGGLAAARLSEYLRDNDFDGEIVILSAEKPLPYQRPALSKGFLTGDKSLPDFTVHDADWYREHSVDLRGNSEVTAIDPKGKTVTIDGGGTVGYDVLVLATGSRPKVLDIPGAEADGVHYLRSVDDARKLTDALTAGTRLAIVGGGWIGLEVAASARARDVDVTVLESSHLPLGAVLGDRVAEILADLHRGHGVDLRSDVTVAEISTRDGRATGVRLEDGTVVEADAVLVAVGATPNIELAESAGLSTADGGVLVDAGLRSQDPDIYVVGDIANADNPTLGHRVRTEHYANAENQPKVVAQNIAGRSADFTDLPSFFSNQYDVRLDQVGLVDPDAEVVLRGDVAGREFLAFWLDGDSRVVAGMTVNLGDQLDAVKALVNASTTVDPARLADPQVSLEQLGA